MKTKFLVLAALALFGCDDDDTDGAAADAGVSGSLSVATYNLGLAPGFVDYEPQRQGPVATALVDLDVDVLCVQELWEPEDIARVNTATAENWPHRYLPEPDASMCASACTEEEVGPLETCVRAECSDVDPSTLIGCGASNCGDEVGALSGACVNCLADNTGKDIDGLIGSCGPEQAGQSFCYAYQGAYGTGIYSKMALTDTERHVFDSTTNARAVLHSKIEGTALGDVHVFCLHLTANLGNIPYTGTAEGWPEENRAQIDALRAYVDEKAGGEPVILLGDFNTGPAGDGYVAELPENYEVLVEGYNNVYIEAGSPECTFCSSNHLVHAEGAEVVQNELIDHILIKNAGNVSAEGSRIMTQSLMIEDASSGEMVEVNLSDHFGLRVDLTVEAATE